VNPPPKIRTPTMPKNTSFGIPQTFPAAKIALMGFSLAERSGKARYAFETLPRPELLPNQKHIEDFGSKLELGSKNELW
jgi:hypothetical protein